jgi:hypothetical protein
MHFYVGEILFLQKAGVIPEYSSIMGPGSRTAPVGLPRLSTPTYRLEACVGHHGVHVFVGRHREEFATRDNGLSRPEYPASNSG